jgi:hypothetical protein
MGQVGRPLFTLLAVAACGVGASAEVTTRSTCPDPEMVCGPRGQGDESLASVPGYFPAVVRPEATLKLVAAPGSSLISIDGALTQRLTPAELHVPPGHHVIGLTYYPDGTFHGPSFVQTFAIDVSDGDVRVLSADFRRRTVLPDDHEAAGSSDVLTP